MNNDQLSSLKNEIIKAVSSPSFKQHYWYKTYHLDIVYRIAMELIPHYPAADKTVVEALVWLHDYEKFVDYDNQYNTELEATLGLMETIGVTPEVSDKLAKYINIFNAKKDIKSAPIEVQIVSSADGAAHMIGPFYPLYWYENPTSPFEAIMTENNRKSTVDWDEKIVLPEVRAAFASRHQHLREMIGNFPDKFLT